MVKTIGSKTDNLNLSLNCIKVVEDDESIIYNFTCNE